MKCFIPECTEEGFIHYINLYTGEEGHYCIPHMVDEKDKEKQIVEKEA